MLTVDHITKQAVAWLVQPEQQKRLDAGDLESLYNDYASIGRSVGITEVLLHMGESIDGILSSLWRVPTGFAAGLNDIKEVVLPSNILTIGDYAFEGCESLEHVSITASKSIGACAFMDCPVLKEVEIGASVKTFYSLAFYNCDSLERIKYNGTTEMWKQISFSNWINQDKMILPIICTDGVITTMNKTMNGGYGGLGPKGAI